MMNLVVLAAILASPALPITADDYDGARADAARRGVPLFVDVWAPW